MYCIKMLRDRNSETKGHFSFNPLVKTTELSHVETFVECPKIQKF